MLVWGAYDFFVNVFEIRPSLVQICFRAIWNCVRWSCKFFLDIVPGRALSESIQHSIITLLSHRLCLLLLFLNMLTLSAAFLLFCACFMCIGLNRRSMRALTLNARKCGARALNNHKCGSYGFKCSKLWELSLQTTRSVGAVVLNAQKYGSSPFRRPKIWELSPQTVKVREFSL